MKVLACILSLVCILIMSACQPSYKCFCQLMDVYQNDTTALARQSLGIGKKTAAKSRSMCDKFERDLQRHYKPDSGEVIVSCTLFSYK